MDVHPRAGQLPLDSDLVDIPALISAYYTQQPVFSERGQRVKFGTSGHRGCASEQSFNQTHILAITQAIADFRKKNQITGPVYVGRDTHALSYPAYITVLQVLLANGLRVRVDATQGYTPTPAVSRAILAHNHTHTEKADGIVITPSHNPPHHGGIKYNPPHGGPAETDITSVLQYDANHYLEGLLAGTVAIEQVNADACTDHASCELFDYVGCYVDALPRVVDMQVIQAAQFRVGIHPLGGSGLAYWQTISDAYQLDFSILSTAIDPSFRFMPLDSDGVIRMDCSSPWAMSALLAVKDNFDLCIGNDADFDRFGLVSSSGLCNPNHMLAIATDYLIRSRVWGKHRAIGKTAVSTALIERICAAQGVAVHDYPVGFKWFVDGFSQQQLSFAGEESAGASLAALDGTPWTTDKDGIVLGLLALEIMAKTQKSLSAYYQQLTEHYGQPYYQRFDGEVTEELRHALSNLTPEDFKASHLGGEPITHVSISASANNAPLGGIKVQTENAWFALRPSGTEPIYKLYAESFISAAHLKQVQEEAREFVSCLTKT